MEENVDEAERVEVFRLYSVGDSQRNMGAFLSEWSKEPDLRPGVVKRVGSIPTECIFCHIFYKYAYFLFWSYDVMVSIPDFESGNLGSNPSKTLILISNFKYLLKIEKIYLLVLIDNNKIISLSHI